MWDTVWCIVVTVVGLWIIAAAMEFGEARLRRKDWDVYFDPLEDIWVARGRVGTITNSSLSGLERTLDFLEGREGCDDGKTDA